MHVKIKSPGKFMGLYLKWPFIIFENSKRMFARCTLVSVSVAVISRQKQRCPTSSFCSCCSSFLLFLFLNAEEKESPLLVTSLNVKTTLINHERLASSRRFGGGQLHRALGTSWSGGTSYIRFRCRSDFIFVAVWVMHSPSSTQEYVRTYSKYFVKLLF